MLELLLMNFNIKKYYYKLFNNQKYKDLKKHNVTQKTVEKFFNKYDSYLREIEKKIKNNKKITFLHSGHLGDLIYSFPVIKELSKNHECYFYIQANKKMSSPYLKHPAGNVFIDDRMLNLFLPLIKEQKFIHKVEKYNNQIIDIDLDIFRDLFVNILFNSPRWYFHITGRHVDLSEPYLHVSPHEKIKNKIIILRTFRGRSQFVNYKFLENYKNLTFIGMKNEYEDLKNDVKNLEFYDCKDFLDMARVIKACKFFVGNKSVGYTIAEALKVPRILEQEPAFPVISPEGKNAFEIFYQLHFVKWFSYLNNTIRD